MRKSKNHTFCFFTLFANALAYGKGECAALYGMCALIYAAQRGKPFGFPLKSRQKILSAQNFLRERVHTFLVQRHCEKS